MKWLIPLAILGTFVGCSNMPSAPSAGVSREIANIGPIRRFLEAAVKSSDNTAYRSVKEMEDKLLNEIKSNPQRYGIPAGTDMSQVRKLDDIPGGERIAAEILADAPRILRFTNKMTTAAIDAIKHEAGLASRIQIGTTNLDFIRLAPTEETGLGRRVSQQIKHLQSDLVSRGVASQKEAKEIAESLFKSAKELAQKAKADPKLKDAARQIIEYSTIISQKTGRKFLGQGGCFKLGGADVLNNKAEIAYRTMKEVEEKELKSYKEIGEALQKQHSDVTGRTKRESCEAIRALTVGASCGDVYAKNLAPTGC